VRRLYLLNEGDKRQSDSRESAIGGETSKRTGIGQGNCRESKSLGAGPSWEVGKPRLFVARPRGEEPGLRGVRGRTRGQGLLSQGTYIIELRVLARQLGPEYKEVNSRKKASQEGTDLPEYWGNKGVKSSQSGVDEVPGKIPK